MGFFSYFLDGHLHAAIKSGDREEVRKLLAEGANPNEKRRRKTPLMVAADCANLDASALLLEKGAELETRDHQGSTALMFAVAGWGYKGSNKQDKCLELVKALLERGADPNACGKRGQTAMRYALGAGHRRIMEVLRKYGATDSCSTSVSNSTPLKEEPSVSPVR